MGWSRAGIYSAYYRALLKTKKRKVDKDDVLRAGKVLVIAQSGIGNLILTLPLIETLHTRLDGAKVDVLVSPRGGAAVLEGLESVKDVMVYDDPKALSAGERRALFDDVRARGHDLTVTSYACNSIESALVSVRSGAKVRAGHRSPARVRPDRLYNVVVEPVKGRHEVHLNLDLAKGLGLEPATEVPRMRVTRKEMEWAEGFLEEQGISSGDFIVGFHPGAHRDMPFKRWKRFADLGKLVVKEMGAKVMVMGGPEEKGLADSIVFEMGSGAISTAGRTGLRQTAALIKCAEVFVSNDSGLMHLSVAVGTPVVALFGPTDYSRTAPAGKHVKVRYESGCGPCYVLPGDSIGCKEIECLHRITPDEVFAALKELAPDRAT
jgi:heptosyltransferase-2